LSSERFEKKPKFGRYGKEKQNTTVDHVDDEVVEIFGNRFYCRG